MESFFPHYKSFVGRDFKAWAQMAPFIICDMLTSDERDTWIALSKVHNKIMQAIEYIINYVVNLLVRKYYW